MPAIFSVSPKIGVAAQAITPAAQVTTGQSNGSTPRLGEQVWLNNGRRAVYGRANASIAASTAVCTVNATTFLVTATGGAYLSPATAMVTGDEGWFTAASV